tara:strand:+ start:1019 stop:2188 length:1170 start_codon:yes stop_codon:yes gene_type:complete
LASWKKVLHESSPSGDFPSGVALANLGGGSGSTFLKKDGTWATPTDTDTNTNQLTTFTLQADGGGGGTVQQGSTVDIAGGTGVSTNYSANTVTVSLSTDQSFGDVTIDEKLIHDGDTNTYLSFGTDEISLVTGGTTGISINSSQTVTIGGDLYIPGDMVHSGDTDTKIAFGTNTITMTAGNTAGLTMAATTLSLKGTTSFDIEGDLVIRDDTGATNLKLEGNATYPCSIEFSADDENDDEDLWKIRLNTDHTLAFLNKTGGSYNDKITFTHTGEVRAINEVTAYYGSDIAMKKNIKPIANPLDKLMSIGGYNFDWKAKVIKDRGGEDGFFVREKDVGIIAQEIETVCPEIVVTREDGHKAVKYEKLAPLLIESIKELTKKVKMLENGNR